PQLVANVPGAKGIVGPWVHKYPHFAVPEPRIGFLQECLRWWDQWLKGRDSGIMVEPDYRAYMQEAVPPRAVYEERAGRWIAEPAWPSPNIRPRDFALNPGRLGDAAEAETALTICSPQTTGLASGEFCMIWLGPEWPTDQRVDDAGSLVFDSAPLDERLEIFGAPAVSLELSVDQPIAFVAVRLCDLAPTGSSTRITYGVLNLTHRESHEAPQPLVPGERLRVRVQLDDIAYALPPGHRLRLAISTAYWPLIWPSPQTVTASVFTGASRLTLPLRPARVETPPSFEPPEAAPPLALEVLRAPSNSRTIETDVRSGETTLRIVDDFGEHRNPLHGLITGAIARETMSIRPDDPLSARAETHWTETLQRGDWRVRTESRTTLWSDRSAFHIRAEVLAFEGEQEVHSKTWDRTVPRDLI
ncbi:MAG: CocE/NonD family hydrolase, partial [Kiloniellales bacterium]